MICFCWFWVGVSVVWIVVLECLFVWVRIVVVVFGGDVFDSIVCFMFCVGGCGDCVECDSVFSVWMCSLVVVCVFVVVVDR